MLLKKSSEPVDLDFLKDIIGDDEEFERELCDIFIENSTQYIAKMEEVVSNGDYNTWHIASHTFKGASASIGAFELSRILGIAQDERENTAEVKQKILSEAKAEYTKVIEYIKKHLDK